MFTAFPDAPGTSFNALIRNMDDRPDDRHVLAVAAGADVVVTDSAAHRRVAAVELYGIEVQTADESRAYSSTAHRARVTPARPH